MYFNVGGLLSKELTVNSSIEAGFAVHEHCHNDVGYFHYLVRTLTLSLSVD